MVLSLLVLISSISFAGGGNRNATAGATQLLIPVGTRGIAMGGATLSNSKGLESLFWNPANIARTDKSLEVLFSHMSYIADIGVSYGAVSFSVGSIGQFALSIKTLNLGDIIRTSVTYPDGTGATFSPQFSTIGLSYARDLSDRITVGLTANLVSETMDQVSASGVAFNLGIAYQNLANIDGLSLGFVIKNLGSRMKYEGGGLNIEAAADGYNRDDKGTSTYKVDSAPFEMPNTLEIGLGYSFTFAKNNAVQLVTTFKNDNFYEDTYSVGAEYGYDNLVFIRGGYTFMPTVESDERTEGFTAGFGVHYSVGDVSFRVDYAYKDVQYFDANHIFSIGIGL
jgi:hypothetical protein